MILFSSNSRYKMRSTVLISLMSFLLISQFFSQTSLSQNLSESRLDELRWYLNPNNQIIRVDLDDLTDESLIASPEMDWGFSAVKKFKPKKKIKIAILDVGIDRDHPDIEPFLLFNSKECLPGNIVPPAAEASDLDQNGYKGDCLGWDFTNNSNRPEDEDGHGTHVAGLITRVLKDHASDFKILPLKVLSPGENLNSPGSNPLFRRIEQAILYAIDKKVDIIHMSLGWPKDSMRAPLMAAIQKAQSRGITLVAAAGNSSQTVAPWPCRLEGVICVGALRPNGELAPFSNRGPHVDFLAPGEKIMSSIAQSVQPLYFPRKGYDYKNGTSQAAPLFTAAFAFAQSVLPQETSEEIFARLAHTAKSANKSTSLKGLYHIERAISATSYGTVYPILKSWDTLRVSANNQIALSVKIKNFSSKAHSRGVAELSCAQTNNNLKNPIKFSFQLKPKSSQTIEKVIRIAQERLNSLDCEIKIGSTSYSVQSKLVYDLPKTTDSVAFNQKIPVVFKSPTGTSSRLITLPTTDKSIPSPIYYIAGEKNFSLFYDHKFVGEVATPDKCQKLRQWQVDLDGDFKKDILIEFICEQKFLLYKFYDLSLKEMFKPVQWVPDLTALNYDFFEVIPQKNNPPSFEFIQNGLDPIPENPWEPVNNQRQRRLYRLDAVSNGLQMIFQTVIFDKPSQWAKDLGFRYTPNVSTLHKVGHRLLIKVENKTAWVDLKTSRAEWAHLDFMLWGGDTHQFNPISQAHIFHQFVTPYEYRGYWLGEQPLYYKQENKRDPFLSPISLVKTANGYRVALRTFHHVLFIHYDQHGRIIAENKVRTDRFDFLGAKDIIATLTSYDRGSLSIQIIDGTRITTQHVDVILNGEIRSFSIPENCVSQTLVLRNEKIYLPMACITTDQHATLNYYLLQ